MGNNKKGPTQRKKGTETSTFVVVYVNGLWQGQVDSADTGEFKFEELYLANDNNTIKIEATDSAGNKAEQEYQVSLDLVPPTFTIDEIPSVSTTPSLTIFIA